VINRLWRYGTDLSDSQSVLRRANLFSDVLLLQPAWTTGIFWLLMLASIGIAAYAFLTMRGRRSIEPISGNWAFRFLIGAMWWRQSLWKLPPFYTDQSRAPFGTTGLAYWMGLIGKHAAIPLQADFVNNIMLPHFYLFAPVVYCLEVLTALSLMSASLCACSAGSRRQHMNGRLSWLGRVVKQRASSGLRVTVTHAEHARLWLMLRRRVEFWARASSHLRAAVVHAECARQWLMSRRRMVFWSAAIGIAVAAIIGTGPVWVWTKYSTNHQAITPLLTLAAGVAVAGVALLRHFAQTDADRQRRITESFSKAIEQLGSDKIEVHLGGIYSLERISKESPDDYWTVMENLTAFVRERSRRAEAERTERVSQRAYFLWLEAGRPEGRADFLWTRAVEYELGELPPTDIASALTVISRRSEEGRKREPANNWRLDLSGAILRGAALCGAPLQRADLFWAHLERPISTMRILREPTLTWRISNEPTSVGRIASGTSRPLYCKFGRGQPHRRACRRSQPRRGASGTSQPRWGTSRRGRSRWGTSRRSRPLFCKSGRTDLTEAHLEGANLSRANLRGASLRGAHLEGADLPEARMERADLTFANLQGANLTEAHLEGADLREALHLSEANLMKASGDASTQLPDKQGLSPALWQHESIVERPQANGA
jgi:uncharacterized protein YjbI with pentapeptide repeats